MAGHGVSLIRMQKVGIKYKKPMGLVVQHDVNVLRREACLVRVGAAKSPEMRGRTGGLVAHFFAQNSRNYFFEATTSK